MRPSGTSERASSIARDHLEPTIFHAPWWLDTATGRQWEAVECVRDGRVIGRMSYLRGNKLWFTTSRMPMLTHFLGPALTAGTGSRTTRALREITITRELIRQLPPMGSFSQRMHKGVTSTLAFQMEGFETSVQFTHEIKPAPADALWRGMRDKTRNVARQAAKRYEVDEGIDAEDFIRLYRDNRDARGWKEFLDLEVARQLILGSTARGCGQIFAARQPDGVLKGAIFCVWDASVCYYLLSTRSLDSGNGAITLLLWSAIQQAAARGLVFDFDGLGYEGAVLFYGGFGAEATPRYVVSRSGRMFRLLRDARRVFKPSADRFTGAG